MTTEVTAVPTQVRLSLAHAAIQTVADDHGIDLLHVKGLALDPTLVWEGRGSTDVDVLVRPGHVRLLLQLLAAHGWKVVTSFEAGSAFEHSTTLWHDHWEHLDLHRTFPGIDRDPARSFDLLWRERGQTRIAGVACVVPLVPAQALILLLHAARAAGDGKARQDIQHVWDAATRERRAAIERLVDELGAEVAFSVILGELESHRSEPECALWKVWSTGGTRIDEWRARVKAAPTLSRKAKVATRRARQRGAPRARPSPPRDPHRGRRRVLRPARPRDPRGLHGGLGSTNVRALDECLAATTRSRRHRQGNSF